MSLLAAAVLQKDSSSNRSWWAVDLGTVFNVKSVNISQRDQFGKINLS